MAVQYLGSSQPRRRRNPLLDIAGVAAAGYGAYTTSQKAADEQALKNLLMRGQLTGSVGTPTARELRGLKRIGITDPSTIHPTAFSQKLAEASSPETAAKLAAMNNLQLQMAGITVPDPVEARSKWIDMIDKSAKLSEQMGVPYTPPASVVSQWPEKMGQEYPMDTVMDPTTGQPISKPRTWTAASVDSKQFQEKLAQLIKQTESVDTPFSVSGDENAAKRQYIEENISFLMRDPNWKERYPDRAALLEQTFQAYGMALPPSAENPQPTPGSTPLGPAQQPAMKAFMSGLLSKTSLHGAPQAPKAPAPSPAPSVTPWQRAAYNTARAAGKSPEEARRLAGF